jgi:diguanylate cyclase (GGDEF)-like protein
MTNEFLPPYLHKCRFVAALAVAPDGTVLDCNDAFRDMLKMREGLSGRPLESLLFPGQPGLLEKIGPEASPGTNVGILLQDSGGNRVSMDFQLETMDGGSRVLLAPIRTASEETLTKLSSLNIEMGNLALELTRKNRELEEANAVITRLMNTDPLTGVANRRHFEEVAEKAMAFSRRQSLPLSLIMADIDYFKEFNDRCGHAMGDEILAAFARMLFRSCRFEDTVARYGGEEFLALLPGTPLVPARAIAERLRENTEKLSISGLEEGIRASFGVTEFLADETLPEFISRADQALYRAKSRGRNRVEG